MDVIKTLNTHPFLLTDAGLETDMIFNKGFELPAFAAHTLLDHAPGRAALDTYYSQFLELAAETGAGYILDAPTWRAQPFFADELGIAPGDLKTINFRAVKFVEEIRNRYAGRVSTIVLNAPIGPRGDAYAPEEWLSVPEYEAYHSEQMHWLAQTPIEMVTALTFTNSNEAVGAVRAAQGAKLAIAVSFTVETDGRLPSGETVEAAIEKVETETLGEPAYYLINCAHPDHLAGAFENKDNLKRIKGLRCNASRLSHEQLDACEELDRGCAHDLAKNHAILKAKMPWLTIWGGCCGTDVSHVTAIAGAVRPLNPSWK